MKQAIIVVFIIGLVIGISYGMHSPILPIFAKNDIGASYSELGAIGLANFIPYMFMPLFVGVLLVRFNNSYLLAVGAAINAVSIYLLSIAQSVPELMGYRMMTGVAHAFFWPPCESIISNASDQKDRVQNISLFTMFFVIGFMIGPLIGNVLIENGDVSHRLLFQIAAVTLAAAIVAALAGSQNKIIKKYEKFSFDSLRQFARFPTVIMMLVYGTASFGIILAVFPAFLDDRSVSDTDVLLLYFIFGISRAVTLGLGGKLARHTGMTLICATFAIAAGLYVSYVAESIIGFAIALLLMGFGFSVFFPLTLEIILSKTRRATTGAIIGAYETVFGIGWAIGPITAGYISQFHGNDAPYVVFFAIGVGVAVISIIRRKSLQPRIRTDAA